MDVGKGWGRISCFPLVSFSINYEYNSDTKECKHFWLAPKPHFGIDVIAKASSKCLTNRISTMFSFEESAM